jgi:hypothetical protein
MTVVKCLYTGSIRTYLVLSEINDNKWFTIMDLEINDMTSGI